MPVPTSYTEKTLAEYMHTSLGKVATTLGLYVDPEGPGSYAEAVNDTLLGYGADDVTTISGSENILTLRALALVAAWKYVVTNFIALYDFSADGATYNRSQMFKNAQEALGMAIRALPADVSPVFTYPVKVIPAIHIQDPYKPDLAEENAE